MTDSEKLGLGLDDIIRRDRNTNRRGGRGGQRGFQGRGGSRGGGQVNGFRAQGGGGLPRPSNAPAGRWKHDLYDDNTNRARGVQRNSGVNSTTKLIISNLDYGVTTNDVHELFEDIGAVRAAHVHFDENGQSLGTAEVIFERRADASTAQQKYNGLNLDGRPMDIKLVGGVDSGLPQQTNRGSFVNGNNSGNQRSGFRFNNQQNGNRGGTNRSRGGGGGGNQQGNSIRGNTKKETITAEDLDAELEAYRAETKFIQHYFQQLTHGCGNNQCLNIYCSSNSSFKYDRKIFEDPNNAAAEAIKLTHEYGSTYLDEYINSNLFLIEENLQQIINKSKEINNWTLLQNLIYSVFSNRQNLSSSFLQKTFPMNILLNNETSSSASATAKSNFLHDSRITLENDEITLDFDMMKRSIKLLMSYEDEISSTINNALGVLFKQISNELSSSKKDELENDANFINIFFIIFQLPCLSDPIFIFHTAYAFYSIFSKLSIDIQAKFVRVLAKHKDSLNAYVAHLQQYITMHTVKWCDHTHINSTNEALLSSEKGMHEGLYVLRILFYANLLGSERETLEILETERENDQRMEVELINRRQRHNDDGADDGNNDQQGQDQQQQQQQQQQSGEQRENRSETATISPTRHRSSSFSMRTSTSEQDEMESIYENPLQIKLGLELNEYRHGYLPFDDFINEFANEKIEINKEYLDFVRQTPDTLHFSFILYPFFLSTINKIALLNIENKVQMYRQRHTSFFHSLFSGIRLDPFFKICVRRNHLIEDALIALEYQGIEQPAELKKQFFVEFEGEQGHDEGGLSKEFFQLITEQIFSPEYGMFMADEETRSLWFNPSAPEDLDREYMLIGMLLGLAIYNSIILDIKFPPVLYRKLMGKIGTSEDLETSHPTIYKSLKNLLSFNEQQDGTTVEDAFCLTFQVGITDATGSRVTFDLKENGENISVTSDNRAEFVRLYSDLLLNKSVEKQFHPFFHGFLLVTGDSSLRKLFRPDEIELLVAGSQALDFNQLASAAEYDGGYTKDSSTIRNFWNVLMSFTDEQKRKFLRFTTGSDRAPIGGLARLKLIISRNGPDTDRLPTAHTCFNAFLLPDYSSMEKLREKLLIAINNAEGFGLL
ncbi:unnamed protein product [Rotaria sp. Silwood1]|nr:unnamed protein product [Rotaria sp. Silwood1]